MDQMGVDDLTTYLESLPPGWVVKLPERLPQERARHTGAVPDWPLPGLVVFLVVAAVVEVGDVVEVPPVAARDEDEDEDDDHDDHDDHDALNPLPRCLGPHPDRLDKPHHEDHPLER